MTKTEPAGEFELTAEIKETAAAFFSSRERLTTEGTKESLEVRIVKGAGINPSGRRMSWGCYGE